VSDAPLVAGSLFGLRTWRVVSDDGGEYLAGPLTGTRWPTGGDWLRASCEVGHVPPHADHDCGIHAWHPTRRSAREVLAVRGVIPGILEAQGPVEVHDDGFRAQRGRPYALVAAPGRNVQLIRRLAERYDAEVVEAAGPDALLTFCRERGLGMDRDVVAELLGIADPDERERAKLRKARIDLLRYVAVVAACLLLIVLGLAVITDPPGERTLYGRTGEIHTR
jgi:hypothetical protein